MMSKYPEDEIYELICGYVNDVKNHHIDKLSLQSGIADIITAIEELAGEVEEGKHELIDDRKDGED